MNPQRNYYFLRQKQEELEKQAKEQEIKDKEIIFRELVMKETQRLTQIQHDTEMENLRHEKEIDRQLYEEEIKMMGILHQNEKVLAAMDYKQDLYKIEKELQQANHLNELSDVMNRILKEQNVAENKRNQILQEKYHQLQQFSSFKDEYWQRVKEVDDMFSDVKDREFGLREKELQLSQGRHSLEIQKGIFETQQERKLLNLDSIKQDLSLDRYRLENKEDQIEQREELMELEFLKKEIEAKDDLIDKKARLYDTAFKQERRRQQFLKEHGNIQQQIEEARDELKGLSGSIHWSKNEIKNLKQEKENALHHLRTMRERTKELSSGKKD